MKFDVLLAVRQFLAQFFSQFLFFCCYNCSLRLSNAVTYRGIFRTDSHMSNSQILLRKFQYFFVRENFDRFLLLTAAMSSYGKYQLILVVSQFDFCNKYPSYRNIYFSLGLYAFSYMSMWNDNCTWWLSNVIFLTFQSHYLIFSMNIPPICSLIMLTCFYLLYVKLRTVSAMFHQDFQAGCCQT